MWRKYSKIAVLTLALVPLAWIAGVLPVAFPQAGGKWHMVTTKCCGSNAVCSTLTALMRELGDDNCSLWNGEIVSLNHCQPVCDSPEHWGAEVWYGIDTGTCGGETYTIEMWVHCDTPTIPGAERNWYLSYVIWKGAIGTMEWAGGSTTARVWNCSQAVFSIDPDHATCCQKITVTVDLVGYCT